MVKTALYASAILLASAASAPVMAADSPLAAVSAPVSSTTVRPKLLHVYATADGETHLEVLQVAATAGNLPLTGLRAISYNPNKVQWHHAPEPQFAINLSGDLQVEVSDGTKRKIGPGDLVYLEDTQGKGHITRLLTPVTALFIHPAAGFDIRAWAKGGG